MKRLYVACQYLLPHHLLSRTAGWLAGSRWRPFKRLVIRTFIRVYGVDMSEASVEDPDDYASFMDFFVRELKGNVRPVDRDPTSLISPADGILSDLGTIEPARRLQAKGMPFTIHELLGDERLAEPYLDGTYATIYLAPGDYHRVHAPYDGKLVALRHIRGRLFAVNPTTAARIPGLLARNERVVMLFETSIGPLAMVLVGAMIVGSIHTPWTGAVTRNQNIGCTLARADEVAQFRMGSTVIVCLPRAVTRWEADLAPGRPVRFGQRLASVDCG